MKKQAAKYNWYGKYIGDADEGIKLKTPSSDSASDQPATFNERFGSFASPGEARAAGSTFGQAFREGFSQELDKTKSDAHAAVSQLIAILGFSASPQLNPTVPATGGSTLGGSGSGVHGMFSDYGVRP
jgi:hypothetical protein